MKQPIDHDRLFKELIKEFFIEFLELFLPETAAYVEPGSQQFMDKEVFTDVTAGERHEADLVAKVRFRGQEAFFLIHIETQSSVQEHFPKRMFRYFARLHEAHDLPVYPIALFSHDRPLRPEPDKFEVEFPDRKVLEFRYRVIQLNRLNWRDFVRNPNPVASALMAKMRIAPQDRPRVKLECLRLLATLRVNPAKMKLIGGFVETYLNLNAEEREIFEQELAETKPAEKETVMPITSSLQTLQLTGQQNLILRLLQRRFGAVPNPVHDKIILIFDDQQLADLAEAIATFQSIADVEAWLAAHPPDTAE